MHTTRIAELLEPFLRLPHPSRGFREGRAASEESAVLSPGQLDQISIYIDLLLRWNSRINLTAVRQPEDIVTRHFGESLFVARHLFPDPADVGTSVSSRPDLIDVGSGAGFPGLPTKIWATQVRVTLIESNQKKATFLREVTRTLTLTNVDVFAGRAADFPATGTVVTLRAVEHFDSILPTALSLVAPQGRFAILVGQAQINRVRDLVHNVRWAESLALPLSSNRILIIGSKESL